jgi:hypothetical protein
MGDVIKLELVKPEVTKLEDAWQRRATAECIKAIRGLVGPGRAIPEKTPVGFLTDVEFGWVVCSVVFAWISTKATQAADEGLKRQEAAMRTAPCDANGVDAWDKGAVLAILPLLADQAPVDWDKPLKNWSKDEMATFLHRAVHLIQTAMEARERAR